MCFLVPKKGVEWANDIFLFVLSLFLLFPLEFGWTVIDHNFAQLIPKSIARSTSSADTCSWGSLIPNFSSQQVRNRWWWCARNPQRSISSLSRTNWKSSSRKVGSCVHCTYTILWNILWAVELSLIPLPSIPAGHQQLQWPRESMSPWWSHAQCKGMSCTFLSPFKSIFIF